MHISHIHVHGINYSSQWYCNTYATCIALKIWHEWEDPKVNGKSYMYMCIYMYAIVLKAKIWLLPFNNSMSNYNINMHHLHVQNIHVLWYCITNVTDMCTFISMCEKACQFENVTSNSNTSTKLKDCTPFIRVFTKFGDCHAP